MSRIGTLPISVPTSVNVTVDVDNLVTVKGPKGELQVKLDRALIVKQHDGTLTIERPTNDRRHRSQHGLARTLVNNCVVGVTEGHQKSLDIIGVGYRAQAEGQGLLLNMGYSHPVKIAAVQGIKFEVVSDDKSRTQKILVSGIDKQKVGQVAAEIREFRKPEPYKGKGIKYAEEKIRRKEGKKK